MDYEYWDIATGEDLADWELTERFEDTLDDAYEDVTIAGYAYSVSRALKAVDPIAYRETYLNWVDGEVGETITDEEPTA